MNFVDKKNELISCIEDTNILSRVQECYVTFLNNGSVGEIFRDRVLAFSFNILCFLYITLTIVFLISVYKFKTKTLKDKYFSLILGLLLTFLGGALLRAWYTIALFAKIKMPNVLDFMYSSYAPTVFVFIIIVGCTIHLKSFTQNVFTKPVWAYLLLVFVLLSLFINFMVM